MHAHVQSIWWHRLNPFSVRSPIFSKFCFHSKIGFYFMQNEKICFNEIVNECITTENYLRHSFSMAKRMYRLRNKVVNDTEIWTVITVSKQDDIRWHEISTASTSIEFSSELYAQYDATTITNDNTMQTALVCHKWWNSFL